MVLAWMLWETAHKRGGCYYGSGMDAPHANGVDGVTVLTWMLTQKYAMCGDTSDWESPETPEVLFAPQLPVPMGSGGHAFLHM